MYCYRTTFPSTSSTSGTLSKCSPLSKVDWSQEEKASEGTGSQCSSQPSTRCVLDKIWKKLYTIWTNPESRRTNTLGELFKILFLVQFTACSEKGIATLSTSITCNDSFKRMKTGEELYCEVCQSPRLPRATLVPNSQHAEKDVLITDSRKSDDRENEVHKHRRTCSSSRLDFRIPGIPHSTVEQVGTKRKETVRRSIEQFENHQNRNMLLKDWEIGGDQPFQSRIKGFDCWNGQYWDLRVLWDFFKETVSRLRLVLGNCYRILHTRKMHAAYGEESTIQQRHNWHIVESWIRNKEEPISGS